MQLLDFGEQPIAHNFLHDPKQDEYVHAVTISYCEQCALIQLVDPIPPDILYTEYVCLSSWKSQPHIPRLVELIESMTTVSKTGLVVEAGCNDGIFLAELRRRGYTDLWGIEPAQDAQEEARRQGIKTIGSYFTVDTAREFSAAHGRCDLFIARQVLEHISDLATFRQAMREILSPGAFVLIEVPNFVFSLETMDYSAIWEEHVNYFTPETLNLFLAQAGITMLHTETTNFSGQALIVLGQYTGEPFVPAQKIAESVEQARAYGERWPAFRNALIQYLSEYKENGQKVAIYGGGCRACSLINFAGLGPHVEFIVDDQPEKQGKYMPGSRLSILPSKAIESEHINLCLLAVNAENEDRVIARHQNYLETGGRFASLHPPSERLLSVWQDLS